MYIGSFNSEAPIQEDRNPACKDLFRAEQEQLLHDLYEIPSRSCDRKVRGGPVCRVGGWCGQSGMLPGECSAGLALQGFSPQITEVVQWLRTCCSFT